MEGIGPICSLRQVVETSSADPRQKHVGTINDTLTSGAGKESLGAAFSKWLCFIPSLVLNLVVKGIKDVIYVVSFCTLCKEHYDAKEVCKALKSVLDTWKKADATAEEKQNAYDAFLAKFPGQRERMIRELITIRRDAALGPKKQDDQDAIRSWNESHAAEVRESSEKRLAHHDAGLVSSYLGHIEEVAVGSAE